MATKRPGYSDEAFRWLGRPSQPLWLPDGNGHYVSEDGLSSVEKKRKCAKCAKAMAGEGNVLCVPCRERIEAFAWLR